MKSREKDFGSATTTSNALSFFSKCDNLFLAPQKCRIAFIQYWTHINSRVRNLTENLIISTCSSLARPAVAAVSAATAAALGVLVPMPCVPVTPAPWFVGSPTVQTGSMPTHNNTAKLMCMWAGVIQISFPGQMTDQVP